MKDSFTSTEGQHIWLIVGQIPIKAGWWDASLKLWDFSQSNKHCIHLSTTKTIDFSCWVFAMSAFAPIEISYSNTVCRKLTDEAWICLISLWWRMVERNTSLSHVFSSEWSFSSLKLFFSFDESPLFSLTFCSCRKKGLIKYIRLISKYMTSQAG